MCDSLISYQHRNIELAKAMNDSYKVVESEIALATTQVKSGMYLEAMLQMNGIPRKDVPKDLEDRYYYVYYVIYRQIPNVTKDKILSQTLFTPASKLYQDSLLNVVTEGSDLYFDVHMDKYIDEKKYDEAFRLAQYRQSMSDPSDRDYATMLYNVGRIKQLTDDEDGFFEDNVRASIQDMIFCVKDHASLHQVVQYLYKHNDVLRAADYLQICMEDADFYNANLRSLQLAGTLPLVTQAYEKEIQANIRDLNLRFYLIIVVFMFALAILALVIIQKNKLAKVHKALSLSNKQLSGLTQELEVANNHLNKVNAKLIENDYIKECYVAHFIQLSSVYMDKNQKFKQEINKKLRQGNIEDALKLTLYGVGINEELEEFYQHFDEAFLSIFPNFIEEYNKLMTEANQIVLDDKQKVLSSELRVFALIRLGFKDSSTIAGLLRYSVNTIYNIRSKAKNKAAVPKDTFESSIMNIGVVSAD